jgi:hypothetical protein
MKVRKETHRGDRCTYRLCVFTAEGWTSHLVVNPMAAKWLVENPEVLGAFIALTPSPTLTPVEEFLKQAFGAEPLDPEHLSNPDIN